MANSSSRGPPHPERVATPRHIVAAVPPAGGRPHHRHALGFHRLQHERGRAHGGALGALHHPHAHRAAVTLLQVGRRERCEPSAAPPCPRTGRLVATACVMRRLWRNAATLRPAGNGPQISLRCCWGPSKGCRTAYASVCSPHRPLVIPESSDKTRAKRVPLHDHMRAPLQAARHPREQRHRDQPARLRAVLRALLLRRQERHAYAQGARPAPHCLNRLASPRPGSACLATEHHAPCCVLRVSMSLTALREGGRWNGALAAGARLRRCSASPLRSTTHCVSWFRYQTLWAVRAGHVHLRHHLAVPAAHDQHGHAGQRLVRGHHAQAEVVSAFAVERRI